MFAQPESDVLVQTASAALDAGQLQAAETALNAALSIEPRHPMALTKLAEIALRRKNHVLATERLIAALAIEAYFAPAWGELSHAYWLAGRLSDALAAARRALDIQPPNPKFRLQLAQLAGWSGQTAEARRVLAPLLQADFPDPVITAAAVAMQGEILVAAGRFQAAEPHLRAALRLIPTLNATRMMLGMNQLRLGRFAEGWTNYAVRETLAAFFPEGHPVLPGAVWQGQDLHGKTILVTDDQGYGDSIQFFRYLPMLQARGTRHITLRSFLPLVRLLSEAAPQATIVANLPEGVSVDYHCTSSSLPRWFGTTLDTIPSVVPYLRPPALWPAVSPRLSSKRRPSKRLQVGLVWSGDDRHVRDSLRSIPAEMFLILADLPGIRFHSLQQPVRGRDQPALAARPAIVREVEEAKDFADTAALITQLDLVITVDTAIAHLAGALAKPVWILLHIAPDWRWLTERTDSPWYPTARLFRVTAEEWAEATAGAGSDPPATTGPAQDCSKPDGGWRPLLRRVAAALRSFAAG